MINNFERKSIAFELSEVVKENILLYFADYKNIAFYDNNYYKFDSPLYSEYEIIGGIGKLSEYNPVGINKINGFQTYLEDTNDWVFGFFGYDLKNEIENLSSQNYDGLQMPDIHFFQPEIVIKSKGNRAEILYFENLTSQEYIQKIIKQITFGKQKSVHKKEFDKPEINQRVTRSEYINAVEKIKNHIQKGDVYEVNYCFEYYGENADISAMEIFLNLKSKSKAPFSGFYKFEDKYIISASPERFLKKNKLEIYSRPMKGTIKKSGNDNDYVSKIQLETDEKERAENTMIVDLVRNDLSRIAQKGSVHVPEFCKVYPFEHVFQMISTVKGELRQEIHIPEILKALFPAGSMTGAPKISALKIIEQNEKTKRGAYSGNLGYIDPNKNFDFNVIIRSLLYNQTNKYVSLMVGSAITNKSDPSKEYEECLLKAEAIIHLISEKI